eukprot:UN10348
MLMDDGRLALIDYGQVKKWDAKNRHIFCKMVLALHAEDKEEVKRIANKEMGAETKNNNVDVIFEMNKFYFDYDDPERPGGENLDKFTATLEKMDPVRTINDEFVLAGRCALILRWMGKVP